MGVSFVLMFVAGIICAQAPHDLLGYGTSYPFFAIGRFLLACATRGIGITGFVMGMCHVKYSTYRNPMKPVSFFILIF
jgi:hypothetical protein